jgi:[ribosomal protein S5]-alanine N-acetyltransferase
MVDVREVTESDAPTLFELLTDPAVTEHVSQPPPSVEAFAGFITWAQRERAAGHSICFGIVPHGLEAAVGVIQIRALEPSFFTAEWGFILGAAFWSTGVFMDAANLVAEFAFTTLKVHRIEARAVCENERGGGALQKLGARPEATLARAFRKGTRSEKQFLWSLREEDWRQRPLVEERLSPADARRLVARANQQALKAIENGKRQGPVKPGAPYPFFVTDVNE